MTGEPCDPTYTNQGDDAFGDKKYVTADLLKKFCRSVSYLKEMADILETETNPQLNKVFSPLSIAPSLSYGMVLNGKSYTLSDQTSYSFVQLFNRISPTPIGIDPHTGLTYPASPGVDIKQTTAFVDLDYPISGEQGHGAVTLKPSTLHTTNITYDKYRMTNYYRGPNDNEALNACWYIGWNENKTYTISSAQRADRFNANIPSVARAIVFEYEDVDNKLITDVTIKPSGFPETEDELYLEIRNVNANGTPGSTVYARSTAEIRHFTAVYLLAFPFPHPVRMHTGTKYAIVVRSPLTTFKHHFGIGGWGINCGTGAYGENAGNTSTHGKVSNNSIYTSIDNAHSWYPHSTLNMSVPYAEGQKEAGDWLFEVNAVSEKDTVTNSIIYSNYLVGEKVYLNPIKTNPVKSVQLNADVNIATGQSVVYEIATNLETKDWDSILSGQVMTFSAPYPTTLYVRATLKSNDIHTTPALKEIGLVLETTEAMIGYIRSNLYYPPTTMPLGMTLWSKISAPFTQDPNTTVAVDIMESDLNTDMFTTNGTTTKFKLDKLPGGPLHYALLKTSTLNKELIEGQDFKVDYGTGIITTYITGPEIQVIGALAAGTVKFEYYPLLIRGLTMEDFPYRLDYRTSNVTPANFHTETQIATTSQTTFTLEDSCTKYLYKVTVNNVVKNITANYTVNNTTNTITFNSGLANDDVVKITYNGFIIPSLIDPIQNLDLNGNSLVENDDFYINYMTNMVTIFTLCASTDTISLGYTLDLKARGLGVNYRVTRSNIADNVLIGPTEYQYRV